MDTLFETAFVQIYSIYTKNDNFIVNNDSQLLKSYFLSYPSGLLPEFHHIAL